MKRISWAICLVASIGGVIAGYHLTGYAQTSADFFASSGAALPSLTRFYLDASDSWLFYIGFFAAFLLVAKEFMLESSRRRMILNAIGFLAQMLFYGLGYWAMSLPSTGLVL
jgi:hypothetical protein